MSEAPTQIFSEPSPVIHGGAVDDMSRRFPNAPQPWLDLSTGINPWPYLPPDDAQYDFTHLPLQSDLDALVKAAAAYFCTQPEAFLLPAAGSELLIRLLPHVLTGVRRVVVADPGYGDYASAWGAAGAQVISHHNPLDLIPEVDAVIVANPNNPDGRMYSTSQLLSAARQLHRKGGWLIVDEAYADLYPELSLMPAAGRPGQIVLRSFGKFFGLPGLRLGWAAAPAEQHHRLHHLLGQWPLHNAAIQTARAAYADLRWHRETRSRLQRAQRRLGSLLEATGLKVLGGTDLFLYVEHPAAGDLWQAAAQQGIYLRRFDEYPQRLRIGLPPGRAQERRLCKAIEDWSAGL